MAEEITTIHEAIHDYTIAKEDYEKKQEQIRKQHQTDGEVLKAIIQENLHIDEDIDIFYELGYIEIGFEYQIPFNVFKLLENTGIQYEVTKEIGLVLRIFLDTKEEDG